MATMSMLGSLVGFTLFGFALDVVYAYWLYCAALFVTVTVTCAAAPEKVRTSAPPLRCSEVLQAYSIDTVAHPDFFWVFVTRTFYYMCISLQALCSGFFVHQSMFVTPALARQRAPWLAGVWVVHAKGRAGCGGSNLLHLDPCDGRPVVRSACGDPEWQALRSVGAQASCLRCLRPDGAGIFRIRNVPAARGRSPLGSGFRHRQWCVGRSQDLVGTSRSEMYAPLSGRCPERHVSTSLLCDAVSSFPLCYSLSPFPHQACSCQWTTLWHVMCSRHLSQQHRPSVFGGSPHSSAPP
mmetsp:Transcript_21325/g.47920  ORF Transcript_21325/g.47920 Transcript_21325/m.47920 type:complete len:295 (-) Transcript_21325:484-1368(-)